MKHKNTFFLLMVIATITVAGVLGCDQEDKQSGEHALYTCSMHPQVIQPKPGRCPICGMELVPVEKTKEKTNQEVKGRVLVDPSVVQNMALRVVSVERRTIVRKIRAVGFLEEAQTGIFDVNLRVSGWVTKLHAHTEGMFIEKGAKLFDIYSPDLFVAVQEAVSAVQANGSRNMQALLQTTQDKLELLGLTKDQIRELLKVTTVPTEIALLSPVTGHIVVRDVVAGARIEAGQRAFRIVDHSTLWLDVRVFERDFPFVHVGTIVEATFDAFPGRLFQGKIAFIHPHVDPVSRSGVARISIANSELVLKPGMYGTVNITGEVQDAALVIPREALLDTGRRKVVFVEVQRGSYEPREVETGMEDNEGFLQIQKGLAAGEQVVASGQFLLDSESRFQEAVKKHLGHGH